MNWLDVAGGIGQGVTGGTSDLREMQMEQLRKQLAAQEMEMNKQRIDEGTAKATTRKALQGIKTPGSDVPEEGFGEDTGEPGVPPKQKMRKVTQAEYQRNAAAAYQQGGDFENANKATEAARTSDFQDKSDAIMAKHRELAKGVQEDPVGFMAHYAPEYYNKMVPDGNSATTSSIPGGMKVAVRDKNNRPVHEQTIPLAQIREAAQNVHASMVQHELGMLKPEDFLKFHTADREDQLAKSKIGLEGAQGQQATKHGALLDAQAGIQKDVGFWHRAQGNFANAHAGQVGAGEREKAETKAALAPLLQQYDALSPEDQEGAKGRALYSKMATVTATKSGDISKMLSATRPAAKGVQKGPGKIQIVKNDDGSSTALGEDGAPLYNIGEGGQPLPVGMTSRQYQKLVAEAQDAGVQAGALQQDSGSVVLAYKAKDGNPYSTLQEARKANKDIKKGIAKPGAAAAAPAAGAQSSGASGPASGLESATPAQLWAASQSQNLLEKRFATEELTRRGLLAPQEQGISRGGGRSFLDGG